MAIRRMARFRRRRAWVSRNSFTPLLKPMLRMSGQPVARQTQQGQEPAAQQDENQQQCEDDGDGESLRPSHARGNPFGHGSPAGGQLNTASQPFQIQGSCGLVEQDLAIRFTSSGNFARSKSAIAGQTRGRGSSASTQIRSMARSATCSSRASIAA